MIGASGVGGGAKMDDFYNCIDTPKNEIDNGVIITDNNKSLKFVCLRGKGRHLVNGSPV